MVRVIRGLGDVGFIVSYLHVVRSGWCRPWYRGWSVMFHLIREELGRIGAAGYHTDLIRRPDQVLLRLDQGKGMSWAKGGYEDLRRDLLEADGRAIKILTGTSSGRHPFVY